MKNLITILLSVIVTAIYAQDHGIAQSYQTISDLNQMVSTADNFNNNIKNNTNYFTDGVNRIESQDVIGSIYLDKNFQKGKIIDIEKGIVIDAYLRYRIIDDTFEVKTKPSDTETILMDRSSKFDIRLGEKSFTFLNNQPISLKGTRNGYVMIHTEKDNVSLYQRLTQDYIPGEKAQTAMESDRKPRLNNNNHYFLKISNNITEIIPHKKEAYKAFPNHQDELKDYIKDQKLKFKSDDQTEDLTKLVEYYASLK